MASFFLLHNCSVLILLVFYSSVSVSRAGEWKVVTCYLATWAVYRRSQGRFSVGDLDPALCDHIVYARVGIHPDTHKIVPTDLYADHQINGRGVVSELVELKRRKGRLKILASVGGWNEGSIKFSAMASNSTNRRQFIDSVMEYVRSNNIDGLDVAWHFPGVRGGTPLDKINFVQLLKELRAEFDKKGYILTAEVNAKKYSIDKSYDVAGISGAVHWMHLISYQYHGSWEQLTGVSAPLRADKDNNTVEFAVDYILENGADKNKVLLGLGTHGAIWRMKEGLGNNGGFLGVAAASNIKAPWSQEEGFIGYNEICWEMIEDDDWNVYWDPISMTPFAVNGRKFVSYDNEKSLGAKMELISSRGLGGASIWSVDTDDFRGLCGESRYPLINKIKTFVRSISKDQPIDVRVVSHYYR